MSRSKGSRTGMKAAAVKSGEDADKTRSPVGVSNRPPAKSQTSISSIKWNWSIVPSRSSTSYDNEAPVIGGDNKCFKHSPRVVPPAALPCIHKHDLEMNQWQETFNTMGRLRARGFPDIQPQFKLEQAPYHCSSLGQHFLAGYGPLSHVKLASKTDPGADDQGSKKETTASACNSVQESFMPHARDNLSGAGAAALQLATKYRPKRLLMPKSAVKVNWGISPMPNAKNYTNEEICEWLSRFGAIKLSVRTGKNCMMVAFEDIKTAYAAVNFQSSVSAHINVAWYDKRMSNFGHYIGCKNYTVSKDAEWKRVMGQRRKRFNTLEKRENPLYKSDITKSIRSGLPM